MAGIRGRNTKPEVELRRALHAKGYRFRLHVKDLPGRPDIVLPRYGAVILVHGCFWHRHEGCRFATTPATRPEFWQSKFDATVERDERDLQALQTAGWRVVIVWECAIRENGSDGVAEEVAGWLSSEESTGDIASSRALNL